MKQSLITINAVCISLLFLAGLAQAQTQTPDFVSFKNGELVWENTPSNTFYQIAWGPSVTNISHLYENVVLTDIRAIPQQQCMTSAVPMFYRIVATDEPYYRTLTVINGAGSRNDCTTGQVVVITANNPPPHQVFDQWTGDTSAILQADGDITATNTTVLMPDPGADITLEAKYKDIKYGLTVAGDDGDGAYTNGASVSVEVNTIPAGYAFNKWEIDPAGVLGPNFNQSATETWLSMPPIEGAGLTLRATYTNLLYNLEVLSGSGSRDDYTNGQVVAIAANYPEPYRVFDHWEGDTNAITASGGSIYATNTLARIPDPGSDITLTAVYTNQLFKLSVYNGLLGSGSYTNGQVVSIAAAPSPNFRVFKQWTGDTYALTDASASNTTARITGADVSVVALYYSAPLPKTLRDDPNDSNVPWPTPRFMIGTGSSSNCVTDHLTGLMWLRNPEIATRTLVAAQTLCETLTGGNGRGGWENWRLPTLRELHSLFEFRYSGPAIPNTMGTGKWVNGDPFILVPTPNASFWSSTYRGTTAQYFVIQGGFGDTYYYGPNTVSGVAWPVRNINE